MPHYTWVKVKVMLPHALKHVLDIPWYLLNQTIEVLCIVVRGSKVDLRVAAVYNFLVLGRRRRTRVPISLHAL